MRGSRTLLGLALAMFLGGILFLSALPSGAGTRDRSVRSVEPGGWRALFLLLRELEIDARPWTAAPSTLPTGPSLLVLPAVPEEPLGYEGLAPREPGEAEAQAPGERPRSKRGRDPLHYRRYLEEGGTILTWAEADSLEFFEDTLALEALQDLELERSSQRTDEAVFADGARLSVEWPEGERFGAPAVFSEWELIAEDEERRGLVLRTRIGSGALVLLAGSASDLFENRELGKEQNALFFVRLLENLGDARPVLFDEYALGGWTPESPMELAFSPKSFAFTLHLLIWGALALWVSAWPRAFARDPESILQVSALARANGFAGFLARSGRWDLLATLLRQGVLRRLRQRAGRQAPRAESSLTDPDPQAASRAALLEARAVLDRVLGPVKSEVRQSMAELFFDSKGSGDSGVRGAEELEELGNRLLEVERLAAGLGSSPAKRKVEKR